MARKNDKISGIFCIQWLEERNVADCVKEESHYFAFSELLKHELLKEHTKFTILI
jgi:hypothetical protein